MPLTSLEKLLDREFQKLAIGQQCHYCKSQATAIHHIIGRADKLRRWDKRNGLPVCWSCHILGIHGGKLKNPEVDFGHIGLKDYLLREGLIYDEFLQAKREEFGI